VTKTFALVLVLVAACGDTKKKDPATPPSGSGDPTANPTGSGPTPPKADNKQLVEEAKQFLAEADGTLRKVLVASAEASWANETDLTPEHEAAAAKATQAVNDVTAGLIKRARKYEPVMAELDPSSKRQLQNLIYMMTTATPIAPSPDDPKQAEELAKIAAEMSSIYGTGKVCDPKTQPARDKRVADIDKRFAAVTAAIETAKDQKARDAATKQLEKLKADRASAEKEGCKDLTAIDKVLQKTRNPAEALALWQGWHDKVGRAERDLFARYVPLANAGAKAIGFDNVSLMWKSSYDMTADAFEAETDRPTRR
jgi:peptidyl-dipeptidase A